MKKKINGGLVILAIAAAAVWNMNLGSQNKNASHIVLDNIEARAACESIGWWDNDGNCVSNDYGVYFCKSDSWLSFTDCLQ